MSDSVTLSLLEQEAAAQKAAAAALATQTVLPEPHKDGEPRFDMVHPTEHVRDEVTPPGPKPIGAQFTSETVPAANFDAAQDGQDGGAASGALLAESAGLASSAETDTQGSSSLPPSAMGSSTSEDEIASLRTFNGPAAAAPVIGETAPAGATAFAGPDGPVGAEATPPDPLVTPDLPPDTDEPNVAPTEILFEGGTVDENAPAGTVVASLDVVDPNTGDTHTLQIIGDSPFEIVGNTLVVREGANLDFESRESYDVTIQATDSAGNIYTQIVTIGIGDVNEAPSAPTLGNASVAENLPGAVIGAVTATDPDRGDTLTYSVSDDRFEVVDGQLKLKEGVSLDYEAEPQVQLTITTTDSGGLTASQQFTIGVTDVNETPSAPTLSNASVAENLAGAVIGDLAATDPDAGDTLTFSVSDDRFEVVDGQLKLKDGISLDYEAEPQVAVTVTTTDSGGLTASQNFTIGVTDVNEAPSAPTLSNASVAENLAGAVIGDLAATDPDAGDTLTFSVSDDRFEVVDGQLKLKDGVSLDYESEPQVAVTVTTTDSGGLHASQDFTIGVTDVNEAPAAPDLSNSTVAENLAGAVIGDLSATDPDTGDTLSFSVSDDRFEVVDGSLKLKDGVSLDHETEPNVQLTLTTTDSGGLHTSQAYSIGVLDVNEAPVGTTIPDQAAHTGAPLSIETASHFSDVDVGDTLTYTMDGPPWLTIDAQTGEITGTPPATVIQQTLTMTDGVYDLPATGVIEIDTDLLSAFAGYQNSVGYYLADATGAPISGGVINLNVRDLTDHYTSVDLSAHPGAVSLGFFLVPEGYVSQPTVVDGSEVSFVNTPDGWQVTWGAEGHTVLTYFSDTALNPDNFDHLIDSPIEGQLNWEDLPNGGDQNFSDLNMNATVRSVVTETASGTVTVTATDSGGLSASQTFALGVVDDNVAPDAPRLSSAIVSENLAGAIIGDVAAFDPNAGDSLTYSVSDDRFEVVDGQLKLKDGVSLDYEAEPNVQLTLTATDSGGLSTSHDVTIDVRDVNEAPNAPLLGGTSVLENLAGAVIGPVTGTDPDWLNTVSFTVSDDRFEVVDGQLKLKDGVSLDHEATPQIELTITSTDQSGLSTSQAYTIAVGDVNEAPTLTALEASGSEDQPIDLSGHITAAQNGQEGTLSITISGVPEGASLSAGTEISAGVWQLGPDQLAGLHLNPAPNSDADFALQVTASNTDAHGDVASTVRTLQITVDAVADAPVLTAAAPGVTGLEDQPIALDLSAALTDTDGSETIAIEVAGVPAGATLSAGHDLGNGTWSLSTADLQGLTITPPHDSSADFSLTVTATATEAENGATATTVLHVPVTVDPVNDAPSLTTAEFPSFDENAAGAIIGPVSASDVDDTSLTYSVSDDRFEVVDGQLKLKDGVSLDHETEPQVTLNLTATDSHGLSDTESFTLGVADVNEAPEGTAMPDQSVTAGTPFAADASAYFSDVDVGDHLTYTIDGPPWLSIDANTGEISGTPPETEPGKPLEISGGLYPLPPDGRVIIDAQILSTNAGYANSVGYYIADADGNPISGAVIDVNLRDFDGNPIEIDLSGTPGAHSLGFFLVPDGANMHPGVTDGSPISFVKTDSGWQVEWGAHGETAVTFFSDSHLNPDGIAHAIDTRDEGNLNWEDLAGGGDQDYNDVNMDVGVRVIGGEPSGGIVTVTATDSGGLSASQSFALGVTDSNLAPGAPRLSNNVVGENLAGAFVGALIAIDPNLGDVLSYAVSDDRFEVVDGQLKLKDGVSLDHEAEPQVTLTVTATDQGGLSSSENFQLDVADANEAPNGLALSGTGMAENAAGAIVGVVSAHDPDAGDHLTYSVSDSRFEVVNGQLKLHDGISLNHEVEPHVALTVTATDQGGLTTSEAFSLNVLNVNEAPVAADIADQHVAGGAAFSLNTASQFSDVDAGDHKHFSIEGPSWMHIDATTGVISGTAPLNGESGTLAIVDGKADVSHASSLVLNTDFFANGASYNNAVGYYIADAYGNPIGGAIVESNAHQLGAHENAIDLTDYPGAATLGFFLIPNGASALADGTMVTFEEQASGWVAFQHGIPITGTGSAAYFSDVSLNGDHFDHLINSGAAGTMNWEDLLNGGDKNFNDANLNATLHYVNAAAGHESVTVTATDDGGLSASDQFDLTITDGHATSFGLATSGMGVVGTEANDWIYGGDGNDTLYGNAGDDFMEGRNGSNKLDGGDGNDRLYGGTGSDLLFGGTGNDWLLGENGNNRLLGGDGNDALLSGSGMDRLYGEAGDDELQSGGGNDKLYGGDGNDTLTGDTGNDAMNGGIGSDLFMLRPGDGADTIDGGAGGGWIDSIHIRGHRGPDTDGSSWTLHLDHGSIISSETHSLTFSADAAGIIANEDGTTAAFTNIERVEW